MMDSPVLIPEDDHVAALQEAHAYRTLLLAALGFWHADVMELLKTKRRLADAEDQIRVLMGYQSADLLAYLKEGR